MLIPKDSTIVIPIWALHFTESEGFEDPEIYRPERYVNHHRLASEYAGAPEYENRDKLPFSLISFAFFLSSPFSPFFFFLLATPVTHRVSAVFS